MNLRVDRDRFLFLVSTLAAAGCSQRIQDSLGIQLEPASSSTATPTSTPASPPATTTAATNAAAPSARAATAPTSSQAVSQAQKPAQVGAPTPAQVDATPTVACGAQNDDGAVDCSAFKGAKFTGPTCEGLSGTCDLLAGGKIYRHRAASAAAACLNRMGTRACDIGVRKHCYEEGVRASCPEAQFASACETKIQQCRAAGKTVTYTKEECMKAASALTGGDRSWALGAMGPSSEGACRLMFTVY